MEFNAAYALPARAQWANPMKTWYVIIGMNIKSNRIATNCITTSFSYFHNFYFLSRNASKITHTVACVCVRVSYLPQVLHAAMYAIKMNAEVFCQPPPRTRPCLMRYNPLEAGILLSLSLSLPLACCSYLFHFNLNCFAYVNQFINVKFNSIPLSLQFHSTFPIDIFHTNWIRGVCFIWLAFTALNSIKLPRSQSDWVVARCTRVLEIVFALSI